MLSWPPSKDSEDLITLEIKPEVTTKLWFIALVQLQHGMTLQFN